MQAVDLGAKYLGLNFWPQSSRFLTLDAARPIVEAVAGRVLLVGVWVDPDRQEVESHIAELSLDLVQFHGDRDPDSVSWFPGRVVKALRIDDGFDSRNLARFDDAWGFLVDCAPPGVFGGTGRSWSYERMADLETSKPVLLAGGLNPDNVAQAIAVTGANLVDVCSGVETSPGVKDAKLLMKFMQEVRNVES